MKKYLTNMTSILTILTLVVCTYAATIATVNMMDSTKVGYIDSGKLLAEYPTAIAARDSLNAQIEVWTSNAKALESELISLNEELVSSGSGWDAPSLEAHQQKITKKQSELARYTQAVQQKALELEQDLMQPVFVEINTFVSDFGSQRGYEVILGTTSGNILYAHEGTDLTEDFLAYVEAEI